MTCIRIRGYGKCSSMAARLDESNSTIVEQRNSRSDRCEKGSLGWLLIRVHVIAIIVNISDTLNALFASFEDSSLLEAVLIQHSIE